MKWDFDPATPTPEPVKHPQLYNLTTFDPVVRRMGGKNENDPKKHLRPISYAGRITVERAKALLGATIDVNKLLAVPKKDATPKKTRMYTWGFYYGFVGSKLRCPAGITQLGYQDGIAVRKAIRGH